MNIQVGKIQTRQIMSHLGKEGGKGDGVGAACNPYSIFFKNLKEICQK